uniref:Uncharacterized protein n=1 Tax=Euplotes crassus TaxID=5936 RepID=Q3I4X2_EUPCR|nr:unknown [Moneuplotes crassus]
MIINLLYSYASNRTKKPYTHQDLQMKLDKKIFNAYEYDFLDLTQFCDADHLTRLAQTTSLMMSTEELHVLRRIENKTIDELDNLDDYHISQIIRSFTKSKYCSGYGSDETFNKLEENIITMIDKFDMKSLSHIIETYGYREQGSPHLHKKFLERVSKNEEALDHYTVANLLYYLMYTDNTDEEIWTQMVQHTLNNNDKIPVTVYTPFKMSRFYMLHHFPELDIRDYCDKFFFPERFYNTEMKENKVYNCGAYQEFVKYIAHKFYLFPVHYVPFHNLFILRACFMDYKIAVNIFDKTELLPVEGRLTARSKLDSKLMSYQGWHVLDISQNDHDDMLTKERDDFYTEWFTQAKAKQIEKGIGK